MDLIVEARNCLLEFCGAGSRVRTRDPLITNQVLYQLSYTGTRAALAFPVGFGKRGCLRNYFSAHKRSGALLWPGKWLAQPAMSGRGVREDVCAFGASKCLPDVTFWLVAEAAAA